MSNIQRTIKCLAAEIMALKARVEDLEDIRDLEIAIAENGDKPLTDWKTVREELEIKLCKHGTDNA